MAQRFFPRATFHLFDPNLNVPSSMENRVVPHKVLLSDSERVVPFFSLQGTGDSYYREIGFLYEDIEPELIRTTSLDSIWKDMDFQIDFVPNLMKLDSQGSELDILKGASTFLHKVKFLILETPFVQYNIEAPNVFQYLEFLAHNNFYPIDILEIHKKSDQTVLQCDIAFINRGIKGKED